METILKTNNYDVQKEKSNKQYEKMITEKYKNLNEFNNKYIIQKIEENKQIKLKKIIKELKLIYPLQDELLMELYNKSISIHQSNIYGNGNFLENDIVVSELIKHNIPFKQQVTINKDGIIVGFNVKNKCYHIIDFVIGNNIEVGKSITEYSVLSCKTTCRERWTQDNWSFTHVPLKYILLTISNDYPSSVRFRETKQRKIITCFPKLKDDRKYKLNFEDMINEII